MALAGGASMSTPEPLANSLNPEAPLESAFAITPSDTVVISPPTRAVYVGTTGNITADFIDGGTSILLNAVPVGMYWWRVSKIHATGTTASNIIGMR